MHELVKEALLRKIAETTPQQSADLLQILKRIAKASEQQADLAKLRYMRTSTMRAPR